MAEKDAPERLKSLAESAADFKVDHNIPIRRYFRSGNEMIKMAEVYFSEDNLEAAYFLYLKFMTLFVEKVKGHRDWGHVLPQEKKRVMGQVKTVMVKTESLKDVLRQRFSSEHQVWLREEEVRRMEMEKYLAEQKKTRAKEESARAAQVASIEKDRQVALWHQAQLDQEARLERGGASSYRVDDFGGVVADPGKPVYDPSEYSVESPTAPPSYPGIDRSVKPDPPSYESVAAPPNPIVAAPSNTGVPSFDRSSKPSMGGGGLRGVQVPEDLMTHFLRIASSNSSAGLETLGTLGGRLSKNRLVITHLVIPKQKGSSDSCTMEGLEEVWEVHDKEDIIFLGWIHTHPAFSVYLSSVDMHNQYEWQHMLPEAVAIVCSIKDDEIGFLTLSPAGMSEIGGCSLQNFHPHSKEPPLFEKASHVEVSPELKTIVKDLR